MLLNQETHLRNGNVILVPYQKRHVPKYHEWMKSEELQKLTASEPLTLEDEYEMQGSWSRDEDKCTFIVLDLGTFDETYDEVKAMIGDVNLFLSAEDGKFKAEVEIMIAEPSSRGKRAGWNATLAMLRYGVETLKIQEFSSKIGFDNLSSQKMFQGMQFAEVSRVEVFQEITFSRPINDDYKEWLEMETRDYRQLQYDRQDEKESE